MANTVDDRIFNWKDEDGKLHPFPAKDMDQEQLKVVNFLGEKGKVKLDLEHELMENMILYQNYAEQLVKLLGIGLEDGKEQDSKSS